MSIRLNVVLSQAGGNLPRANELEGELVAQLIGLAGLDLTLIGRLDRLSTSATDRLALEGLSGDFVLLTWRPVDEAMAILAEQGIVGVRTPHGLDPACDRPEGGRRIFFVGLESFDSNQVIRGLQQLLQSRRTSTVSIGIAATMRSGSSGEKRTTIHDSGLSSSPQLRETVAHSDYTPPREQQGADSPRLAATDKPEPTGGVQQVQRGQRVNAEMASDSSREAALDALVDDLNAFDI